MEHTKTPWYWRLNIFSDTPEYGIYSKDFKHVIFKMQKGIVPRECDSDFIIRAVNSHEKLVQALGSALSYIQEIESQGNGLFPSATAKQIQEALALAEK